MVTLGCEKMQEQIEAVQRMQEYIEKHLCENISFADVAKASLLFPSAEIIDFIKREAI